MRILLLAPHPFFQVRGSPIDVDLLVGALGARANTHVDLVTYAEGEDRSHPGVTLHRIRPTPFTRNVRPGFSLKKLVCDVQLLGKAWSLVRRHEYDVVHAGEEAVFIAMLFKALYGIPFVYDLDSSIAQQMVERLPVLRPLAPVLDGLEGAAVRSALATAPVCNALRDHCEALGARRVFTLHDISQFSEPEADPPGVLREVAGEDALILLYVGSLEPYQGLDLLLRAFASAAQQSEALALVVIGGITRHIERYRRLARRLGIPDRTHFLGPRPIDELAGNLADADILVSPRTRGINTPMKVFSYLASGRPVLAVDLPTHSQILTPEIALLAEPEPQAFARAILTLARDTALRQQLGKSGRAFAEADHTYGAHQKRVDELYDWVAEQIATPPALGAATGAEG